MPATIADRLFAYVTCQEGSQPPTHTDLYRLFELVEAVKSLGNPPTMRLAKALSAITRKGPEAT